MKNIMKFAAGAVMALLVLPAMAAKGTPREQLLDRLQKLQKP